jgi:hypothetical protein
MRIILNSDVLHMQRLLTTGLAKHIDAFCRTVAREGAVLVLPRAVVLENERHQSQLWQNMIKDLQDAASKLRQWKIVVPDFDARALVERASLIAVLRDTGATIELEEPTLEDYRDAEHRAALRLPPCPANAKSDEMRDLVIWAVAVRTAKRDGGAILVSRDEVHNDELAAAEANAIGLRRAKDFDDALDVLGLLTPVGELAGSVLATVWAALRQAGLPLPDEISLRRVKNAQFRADDAGHVAGSLTFAVPTDQGMLSAVGSVAQARPGIITVELTDIRLDNNSWRSGSLTTTVVGELPRIARPADERLSELRKAIEDET